MIIAVRDEDAGRYFGLPYGKPRTCKVYTIECDCGCGTIFELRNYVRKNVDRYHYYAWKSGKSIDEICPEKANNTRDKLSKLALGRPNPRKGKTDEESKIASENLELGKLGPYSSKTGWMYNPFTKQDEFMHSSWESEFLRIMILRNIPVTKKHLIRILYVDDKGKKRRYTPDFVNLTEKTVYEIKGHFYPKDFCKIAALRVWAAENEYKVQIIDTRPTENEVY